MNLIEHAKRELATLRSGEPDEMQDAIEAFVLDCVEAFARAEHSGSSAAYTIGILERVLRFEPLAPLTGEDDEWSDPQQVHGGGGGLEQNKRCSHVFREGGQAYDDQAIVWRDPDGTLVTNYGSRRNITFPYTPTQEIRDRA